MAITSNYPTAADYEKFITEKYSTTTYFDPKTATWTVASTFTNAVNNGALIQNTSWAGVHRSTIPAKKQDTFNRAKSPKTVLKMADSLLMAIKLLKTN